MAEVDKRKDDQYNKATTIEATEKNPSVTLNADDVNDKTSTASANSTKTDTNSLSPAVTHLEHLLRELLTRTSCADEDLKTGITSRVQSLKSKIGENLINFENDESFPSNVAAAISTTHISMTGEKRSADDDLSGGNG